MVLLRHSCYNMCTTRYYISNKHQEQADGMNEETGCPAEDRQRWRTGTGRVRGCKRTQPIAAVPTLGVRMCSITDNQNGGDGETGKGGLAARR